jgi:hypothetical protein
MHTNHTGVIIIDRNGAQEISTLPFLTYLDFHFCESRLTEGACKWITVASHIREIVYSFVYCEPGLATGEVH